MFKKVVIVLLALIVASFVGCQWDYYLSKHLFNKYCNDGRVGQFIYETVELPDEFFEPLPTKWIHHEKYKPDSYFEYSEIEKQFFNGVQNGIKKGIHYRFKDGYRISRNRFEKDYIFEVYKKRKISRIGPIYSIKSSVIRKKDNKLLGEVVSLKNHKGWLNVLAAMGQTPSGDTCPIGNHYKQRHQQLIKNIFASREMESEK